ncbi:hypothetical protein [Polaromonas sp. JS666]|uniref:hypothetical protein n=1 Tax=Polaromonas sp. (strain JS666 / ATCC BAA-500) TaxID=296591 RepID=UPI000046496A|nr:hypothetical protein [Polaromonas sp. JS666]ABE43262.1 hypothetical protein Bpro_1312 [Polaromonas sp. JS666]
MKTATIDAPVELQIKPRPRFPQLKPSQLALAEAKRNSWTAIVTNDTTVEALQCADFWPLVADRLSRRDLIEVQPEDSSWWAELLVRDCGQNYAVLVLLRKIDLPPLHPHTVDALPAGHTCEFLGPERLWGILRGSEVLRAEFQTKGEACMWIIEALRS